MIVGYKLLSSGAHLLKINMLFIQT